MEIRRIQEDINQLLIRLEEQYGRVLSYGDAIPSIEMDLVLKDCRDLYEGFIDLKTAVELQRRKAQAPVSVKAAAPVSPEPAVTETPSPSAEVPQPVAESKPVELAKPVVDVKPAEAAKPVAEVKPVEVPKAVEEKAAEKKEEAPIAQNSPVVEPKANGEAKPIALPSENPPVIAPKVDLLQERQKDFVPTVRKIELKPTSASGGEAPKKESLFEKAASLYDKIAKPAEKTVAGQASRQPISNIKAAIGINEKFAYLKELFKNNVNDYNEALEKLNNFDSYADAEDYFQELKAKYGWDPESKTFQGLAELLNRRYLHNA